VSPVNEWMQPLSEVLSIGLHFLSTLDGSDKHERCVQKHHEVLTADTIQTTYKGRNKMWFVFKVGACQARMYVTHPWHATPPSHAYIAPRLPPSPAATVGDVILIVILNARTSSSGGRFVNYSCEQRGFLATVSGPIRIHSVMSGLRRSDDGVWDAVTHVWQWRSRRFTTRRATSYHTRRSLDWASQIRPRWHSTSVASCDQLVNIGPYRSPHWRSYYSQLRHCIWNTSSVILAADLMLPRCVTAYI